MLLLGWEVVEGRLDREGIHHIFMQVDLWLFDDVFVGWRGASARANAESRRRRAVFICRTSDDGSAFRLVREARPLSS